MPLPIKLESRPLSYSSLSAFSRSPAHYIEYLFRPRVETPSTLLGSAVDCLVLTPNDFDKNFAVSGKFKLNTNIGKAEKKSFAAKNANKTILDIAMYDKACRMRDALLCNKITSLYIRKTTERQKKVHYTDKKTGLPLVCFMDAKGKGIIEDLKTTKDALPSAFSESVFKYKYHIQAAIYVEAMAFHGEQCDFYWVCVESGSPYGVSVIKASEEVLNYGKRELHRLLDAYKYCMDNDLWKHSYDFWQEKGGCELQLPEYLKK